MERVEAFASAPPMPIQRGRLAILLGIIAALIVASNVGTILSASLVRDHPVALLALSARNRHLLLTVAAGIGAVPYVLVSFARIVAPAATAAGANPQALAWNIGTTGMTRSASRTPMPSASSAPMVWR